MPEEPTLKPPQVQTPAGTGDVWKFHATVAAIFQRDAEEILDLKRRVAELENREDG